jgi:hypothetical protein
MADERQGPGANAAPQRARVLVVVNKWWECDPVMNVLLHDLARPHYKKSRPADPVPFGALDLPWPCDLRHPRQRPPIVPESPAGFPEPSKEASPRAVFEMTNVDAEIWCISDFLEHLPDKAKYQSSSSQKATRLPKIVARGKPSLVMAVGTAGHPGEKSLNGCVLVGTNVFMHDCHPAGVGTTNQDSDWHSGPFDTIIQSTLTEAAFATITGARYRANPRLIVSPGEPAAERRVIADYDLVALGALNVTNYLEYDTTDQATLDAYIAHTTAHAPQPKGSLETTHGLIRVQSDAPFLFVSGITDRVGYFADEVSVHEYAQNFVAAHNAGIAVAWMLPQIDAACEAIIMKPA